MREKGRKAIEAILSQIDETEMRNAKDEKNFQEVKGVVVESAQCGVTIFDQRVSVSGDHTQVAGPSPMPMVESASNLMGLINAAVHEIYEAAGEDISMEDVGRLDYETHAAILAACQSEEEYPHALEIMKIRLRKKILARKKGDEE